MNRPAILKNFDSLSIALETQSYKFIHQNTVEGELFDVKKETKKFVKSKIAKHRNKNKDFYKKYCYEWMLDFENFQNPLEAMYQLWVVSMLASNPKKHPSRDKFSNIAVRFLPCGNAAAESIYNNGFRYIIISTAFVGLAKSYAWLNYSLAKIGTCLPRTTNFVNSNIMGGADIEASLRSGDPKVLEAVNDFLQVAIYFVKYQPPPLKFHNFIDHLNDPKSGFVKFGKIFTAIESYLLYHELAHLLEHDFSELQRTTAEELHADKIATSMLIRHTQINKTPILDYYTGPIVCLQLFRLFHLVRTVVVISDTVNANQGAMFDIKELGQVLLASENELSLRLHGLRHSMLQWGVLKGAEGLFSDLTAESHLAIVACQGQLIADLDKSSPFNHYEVLLKNMSVSK
ncbi:hypothetical protein ABC383_15710 [Noviherbaspirillum sp. 1P10PC]|uniref:hypothetical protein n=1 Tax=Noviherbaspirillum sp. 1P10PC TaxID=3132292 RepID=UPI0039A07AAC